MIQLSSLVGFPWAFLMCWKTRAPHLNLHRNCSPRPPKRGCCHSCAVMVAGMRGLLPGQSPDWHHSQRQRRRGNGNGWEAPELGWVLQETSCSHPSSAAPVRDHPEELTCLAPHFREASLSYKWKTRLHPWAAAWQSLHLYNWST